MSTFSLKNNTELGFFPCATHTELFPPIAESDFQVIFINVSHFKYSNPYNKMPIRHTPFYRKSFAILSFKSLTCIIIVLKVKSTIM